MIPKQAIEKAIAGGWNGKHFLLVNVGLWMVEKDTGLVHLNYWNKKADKTKDRPDATVRYHWEQIALDPAFWQTLGKALGWTRTMPSGRHVNDPSKKQFEMMEDEWKCNAHRFYDLILTEQPTGKFWEELLGGELSE